MQNAVALQVKRLMGKAMFSFSFNEKVIPAIFRSATFKLSETHYTPTIKKTIISCPKIAGNLLKIFGYKKI